MEEPNQNLNIICRKSKYEFQQSQLQFPLPQEDYWTELFLIKKLS